MRVATEMLIAGSSSCSSLLAREQHHNHAELQEQITASSIAVPSIGSCSRKMIACSSPDSSAVLLATWMSEAGLRKEGQRWRIDEFWDKEQPMTYFRRIATINDLEKMGRYITPQHIHNTMACPSHRTYFFLSTPSASGRRRWLPPNTPIYSYSLYKDPTFPANRHLNQS